MCSYKCLCYVNGIARDRINLKILVFIKLIAIIKNNLIYRNKLICGTVPVIKKLAIRPFIRFAV